MPANKSRKYQRIISYIEDEVGADVNRDLLKVALTAQDEVPIKVGNPQGERMDFNLFGTDPNGEVTEVQAIELGDQLSSTSGTQATYLARALASQDIDEFITRVTDSTGSQIDPLTQAVTASAGNDSVRVVSPSPLDVSASEVDVDIATQSLSPLTVTDDGNLAISAWNAGTLTVTDDGSLTVSGTVTVQENTPLDVSAATVPIDIQSEADTKTTTQIASGVDISGGVSHQIGEESYSVYVSNTGSASADVTLSYSPDGGGTYISDPDGSVTVGSGAGTIFAIDYDATHIQVTASNTETFNVWVVEQ